MKNNYNKNPWRSRAAAAGLASAVALAASGCATAERGGSVSSETVATHSEAHYSQYGSVAMQTFGINGSFRLQNYNDPFTSETIVYCLTPIPLVPSTDRHDKLIIGEIGQTLWGDVINTDLHTEDTVTVAPYTTCADYFPTIDREKLASEYVVDSLNSPDRTNNGDGVRVEYPTKVAADLLQRATNGTCPPSLSCPNF
jgi:hypothetical protein